MEADLQRFYNVDYRDRWRGGLSLRRILVLLRHLPPESAIAALGRDGAPHWTIEAQLLDDLRIVLTSTKKKPSKPHPNRPRPQARVRRNDPKMRRRLAAAKQRAVERRRAIEAGEIT